MWYSVDCAVQGLGHISENIPCQDKTCTVSEGDARVIVLADGAGSASMSHFGAEAVVKKTAELLCSQFDEFFAEEDGAKVKTELHKDLISELSVLAEELGCECTDLASTLLAVAIKDERYIIVHIGDGVIGYLKEGELKVASEPKNGEFSNITIFVTSANALYEMKMMKGYLGEITGFVIMSDGAEASLYNRQKKYLAPVIKKVMHLCTVLPEFVVKDQLEKSFSTVVRNSTQDDCSIAILVKGDGQLKYFDLSDREKQTLLRINPNTPNAQKRLARYGSILKLLEKPCSRVHIARAMHVKPKHIKKHLDRLLSLGLIERTGGVYYSFLAQ